MQAHAEPFVTKIIGREGLQAIAAQWQELCDRAVEPNVYFSPHYMQPLLQHVEPKTKVEVLTIWRGEKLVGFFPFTRGLGVPGLMPAGKAWLSLYTFTGTPLFDREHVEDCAESFVTALSGLARGEWLIPDIRRDGPVAAAICDALLRRISPHTFLNAFERAALEVGQSFDDHMKQHLSTNLRKNLAKRRRKLEEMAKVEHRHCATAADLDIAVQAFLEIEVRGWKGKRGTALTNDPGSKAFGIEAFGGKAAGYAQAEMLLADGKPIAVILTVISGDTGFTVKNAYDEDYADVTAGLLLEVEFLRNLLGNKWVARIDAGTAGEHVIDRFWPGRLNMADLVFSLAPALAQSRLSIFEKRNHAVTSLKPKIKKLLRRE